MTCSRDSQQSQRSRHVLAAAAAASVGLAGFSPVVRAELMVDLRATFVQHGSTLTAVSDPKYVSATVGDTVLINVVARIRGTNAVQLTGNFDNSAPATDTRNDDGIISLEGSFQSVGALKGNFDPSNQGNGGVVTPWNGVASSNGVAQDFDSDGDLDIGAISTDPTTMWIARANGDLRYATMSVSTAHGTRLGTTTSNKVFIEDTGGPNGAVPATRIIDPSTSDVLMGELTFKVTAGANGVANLNYVPRLGATFGTGLWFLDGGVTTATGPADDIMYDGQPVRIGNVGSPPNLNWSGAASSAWDQASTNWTSNSSPATFSNGKNVFFGDAGAGLVNVDPAGVTPTEMTINTDGAYTFSGGPIGGSGPLAKYGRGALTLASHNSYTGGTSVKGGTLVVDGGDDRLGATGTSVVLNGGVLRTDSTGINTPRGFLIDLFGGTIDTNGFDSTLSGVITGSGIFTKRGAGTLVLLGNSNSKSNNTIIDGGTLQIGNGGTSGSLTSGQFINSGTLVFNRSNALTYSGVISGSGSLVKSGSGTLTWVSIDAPTYYSGSTSVVGGKLSLANDLTGTSAVNVSSGATLEILPSSNPLRVLSTASISIAGTGRLDIQSNKLITATPVGTLGAGGVYSDVTGLIQSGRNGEARPLWDGGGIVTSQSAASNGNYTSIGVAQASDVRPATATATGLWSGLTISGTDTLVMYTYGGDATLDGNLSIDDYTRIDAGFANHLTGWSNGDFNYDGKINIDDYAIIDANLRIQGAGFATAGGINGDLVATIVGAVPEPAGFSLLVGATALLVRRRRSSVT